jgi:primary-amine oxidase
VIYDRPSGELETGMTKRSQTSMPGQASEERRHPLDPLSQAELAAACDILKSEKRLGPDTRFGFVQLEEPAKADVLGWKPGRPLQRRAAATVFDSKTGATHLAVVDLGSKTVAAWREHPTKTFPYGQPPVIIEEFFKVGDIVKADAGWRRAMQRRGLTDKDIDLIQVDPFSAGYFDREVEKGRRLVSAVSYWST